MPQQARNLPVLGTEDPDYLKGACAVNVLGCTELTVLSVLGISSEKLEDQVTPCAAATQAAEAKWARAL